jgi:hypothetical protein
VFYVGNAQLHLGAAVLLECFSHGDRLQCGDHEAKPRGTWTICPLSDKCTPKLRPLPPKTDRLPPTSRLQGTGATASSRGSRNFDLVTPGRVDLVTPMDLPQPNHDVACAADNSKSSGTVNPRFFSNLNALRNNKLKLVLTRSVIFRQLRGRRKSVTTGRLCRRKTVAEQSEIVIL